MSIRLASSALGMFTKPSAKPSAKPKPAKKAGGLFGGGAAKPKAAPAKKSGGGGLFGGGKPTAPPAKKAGGGGLFGGSAKKAAPPAAKPKKSLFGGGAAKKSAAPPAKKAGGGGLFGGSAKAKAAPAKAKRPSPPSSKKPAPKATDRKLWFPGAEAPPWLDGSLPGDVGCDPFSLSAPREFLQFGVDDLDQNTNLNRAGGVVGRFKKPSSAAKKPVKGKGKGVSGPALSPYDEVFGLERFRECELIHGRWAMLAVAGCVAAEAVNGIPWQEIGAQEIDNANYAGVPLPLSLAQITAIEALLVGYIEVARNTSTDTETRCYPGGNFDPFGLSTPDSQFRLRTAEVKHSRLAMVAFLAMSVQALRGFGALETLQLLGPVTALEAAEAAGEAAGAADLAAEVAQTAQAVL